MTALSLATKIRADEVHVLPKKWKRLFDSYGESLANRLLDHEVAKSVLNELWWTHEIEMLDALNGKTITLQDYLELRQGPTQGQHPAVAERFLLDYLVASGI